ncbi:TetR/AcrR family transcriptional regulator [Sphingomonas sp. PL-96]|uniref:TetR/AcrR family transcriptional regulator n=1 Tax=Sphingomonas sp. PL-96 TaxID=2887201 RepID=UPI00226C9101|nr:TetR/AcrR family transcriptional regulator [Sphingomonas sp. PL-96]MCC2978324.1 TetR/AcrR family transcriptional regulator [Sphingomonas sp. PL-96]
MAPARPIHDTRSAILTSGQSIMSRKGFSGVGLNEILSSAGVPKGSFYHFFPSKDAFGEAMLATYFDDYLAEMEQIFGKPGLTAAERLMLYFANWRENQGASDCQGRCLAVKLGAEVADLSEPMRLALKVGTAGIVSRLTAALEVGVADGSLHIEDPAADVAAALYNQWLGASVMAKIVRTHDPFESALQSTRRMLSIPKR